MSLFFSHKNYRYLVPILLYRIRLYNLVVLQESDDEEDRRIEMQRRKEKEKRREEQEKYRSGPRTKSKQKNNDDHLDPMDPAAYSDVPRYESSSV